MSADPKPPRTRPKRHRRIWVTARGKVEAEGRCRVCGSQRNLEAAHVLSRRFDEYEEVQADDVVPMCRDCHTRFDARTLDLLPYLTRPEQSRAVLLAGWVSAGRRMTGSRELIGYREVV